MPNGQTDSSQITEFSLNTLLSTVGKTFKNHKFLPAFEVFFLIKQLLSNKNGIKYDIMQKKFINFASKFNFLSMDRIKDLNRIKVVLAEKHLTSKWLAEQLGKSTCTVSKWCSQKSQPDLQTIDQIAKLLDVKRSDLIVD